MMLWMQAAPNYRHFDGGQEKIPEEIVVAFWEMLALTITGLKQPKRETR